MEFIVMYGPYIVNGLFMLLASFAGIKWRGIKKTIKLIIDAWEDDKITPEEFNEIMKSIREIYK